MRNFGDCTMIDFRRHVFTLVARMGGSENVIAVNRTLCQFMGGLEGGVFLAQMLHWCDKGSNPQGWIYKTYAEWEEETFLSKYQVNQAAKKCIERGFLETTVRKARGNPTVHYRLLQDEFITAILAFVAAQGVEMESKKFDEPLESQEFDEPKSKIAHSLTENTYPKNNAQRRMRPTQGRTNGGQRRSYNPDDYDNL
jgi:hypothetical protein